MILKLIAIEVLGVACLAIIFLLWQAGKLRAPRTPGLTRWGSWQKAILVGFSLLVLILMIFPGEAKSLWNTKPMVVALIAAIVILAVSAKKQGEGFVNIARFVAIIALIGILGYHLTPAQIKKEVSGWFSSLTNSDNRTIEDRSQISEMIVPPDSLIKIPVLFKKGDVIRIRQLDWPPGNYALVGCRYNVSVRSQLYQARAEVGNFEETTQDPNLWIKGGSKPVRLKIQVIPL